MKQNSKDFIPLNNSIFNFLRKLVIAVLCLSPIIYQLNGMIQQALNECSNLPFLGWDPVSRFQTSLSFANSIRNLKLHQPIIQLLDSPTWPSIRSIPESILILVFGANPLYSIWITVATFVTLLIAMALILFKELGSKIYYPIVSISLLWITLIPPYQLYIFSGMLEIQGGLFLLLTIFYLKKIKTHLVAFLLSYYLLLQTKYPYAILFLLSLTTYLPILYRRTFRILYRDVLDNYIKYIKTNSIFLFIPIPLILLILGKYSIIYLPGRLEFYLIYLTAILFLTHVTYFLITQKSLIVKYSHTLYKIMFYCILASIWFLFVHPERFHSSFLTYQHNQKDGEYFFYLKQIFQDIPYYWLICIAIIILSISYLFKLYYNRPFNQKIVPYLYLTLSKWILSNPYLYIGLIIIIGQSIITPNQQSRHIYHTYPTMIVGGILGFFGIIKLYLSRNHNLFQNEKLIMIPYILFFLAFLYFSFNSSYNVCYAGSNFDVREVPLFIRDIADSQLNKNTILFNDIDSNHINKPDSELEVSIHAYNRNLDLVLNPRKILDKHNDYQLVRISFECNEKRVIDTLNQYFPEKIGLGYRVVEIPNSSGRGCYEQIEFVK